MLTLRYKADTTVPVEVEGLTPSAVRGLSIAEIQRFDLFHGNRKVPLAEFFEISGDPTDARMEFEGDLAGVHWIGAQMSEGEIHVRGNAGRHAGGTGARTMDIPGATWILERSEVVGQKPRSRP